MSELDPRITPAKPNLAAEHLRGKVTAARYTPGIALEIVAPKTNLLREPSAGAQLESELLFGERFIAYELDENYTWGQAEYDGYVGYVTANSLAAACAATTHRVSVRQSRTYTEPSGKAFSPYALSLGSRLAVVRDRGRFLEVASPSGPNLFVPSSHLTAIGEHAPDFVAVAAIFLGVPYLWGGRTSAGLDCSALVQLALAEAGIKAPRDSDQQREAVGETIGGAEALAQMQRGDLVFWNNHVAIAFDERRIIHANALAMAVSIDDAAPFARAVEASDGPVLAVKRLK
ncbi:MAG: C40 family peptidase [Alphaproteobacteria bacterium]